MSSVLGKETEGRGLAVSAQSTSSNSIKKKNDINRTVHLVFFVHGLGANPKELEYLKNAMEQLYNNSAEDDGSSSTSVRYICDNSNTGNTMDGFLLAGERLAKAVQQAIDNVKGEVATSTMKDKTTIYLSMIGYSCGGNFCRSALKFLNLGADDDGKEEGDATSSAVMVVPLLFCIIASPTLGLGHQTYFPRWFETAMSHRMGSTGHDMNLTTSVVHDMATSEEFLGPLRTFRHRMVVANAFHTDVAVPTPTAAFLSKSSTYPHVVVPQSSYLLVVTTTMTSSLPAADISTTDDDKKAEEEMTTVMESNSKDNNNTDSSHDMSFCLDSVGWTKIFLDLRDAMPGPSVPTFSKHDTSIPTDVTSFTSQELYTIMNRTGKHWKVLPFGHPLVVASQKHGFYKWLSKGGGRKTHYVDQLAKDFVEILRNA